MRPIGHYGIYSIGRSQFRRLELGLHTSGSPSASGAAGQVVGLFCDLFDAGDQPGIPEEAGIRVIKSLNI